MNRFIAPFAALAFLFSAATATGGDATGKISAVDASSITLEDGTTFTIGDGVTTEGLEPGTEVTVSLQEQDGEKIAKTVIPTN